MAIDYILLNTGDKVLLNDGSGILLNTSADTGVILQVVESQEDNILLNTEGNLLLNNGDKILLNTQVLDDVIAGANQSSLGIPDLVIPSRRVIVSVSFTTVMMATVLAPTSTESHIRSSVLVETVTYPKVKSSLLRESECHKHFNASTLAESIPLQYKLVQEERERYQYKLSSKSTIKRIKEKLKRIMSDVVDD